MSAELQAWLLRADAWVYLLLFLLVFCEIGIAPLFFLPGDPLLFFCGTLAAGGILRLALLLPLVACAALGGSLLAYALGCHLRRHAQRAQWRWLDPVALRRAQEFFARHGALTLLVSPYVAVLRTFAPLAAGVAGMAAARFVPAAAAGAGLWSVGLLSAGYFFGHIPLVRDHIGALALLGLVLGLAGLLLRRRGRTPQL
ncbi:hypothetical protein G8A07_23965 [Roseateles sp. DAIF2]|uniref:DedA family protein n=1 Tax=Roseateles sp. DAIF2 TaxID=2714952 RepID=UPI0018A310D5|nr:VTT domain-containing protein [Roseateles sp. DAIF2]QPF75668.1 hypothetical protein G8A07_23965 [Roseateles sp. DAIF2]